MKKFKKEAYIEQYEKNVAIFGLFVFIIFGVIFLTFLLPGIYNLKNNINNSSDAGKVTIYESAKNTNNYKSGISYFKNNNYSEALNYFKKAAEKEPSNINILTELAITHYRLKNYDESIDTYKRIINIDKNNVIAYNSIGNNYWIKKDYASAEKYFLKAIEIDPYSIPAYNNLALMLDEIGKKEDAISAINRGLDINSNSAELKITLRILEK